MPHGPGCRPTTAGAVPGGGLWTGRPPAWPPSADGSAGGSAAAGDALHTQAQHGSVLVLFLCAVLQLSYLFSLGFLGVILALEAGHCVGVVATRPQVHP